MPLDPHEVQAETVRYLVAKNQELAAEVVRLTSELAAAQPVVEWRRLPPAISMDLPQGWGATRGRLDFVVYDHPGESVGWKILVQRPAGRSVLYADGPETGPAGKAACEAAYRRAAGWVPSHARLEWTREFDDFSLVFHYDALPVKLWSGKLYSNGTGWAFNDSTGNLYNGSPLPKAEIVRIIAEWCAASLPSLHLPPFPGASDAS